MPSLSSSRLLPFLSFLLVLGTVIMGATRADDPTTPKLLSTLVKEWNAVLERTEKNLLKPDLADDRLDELRAEMSDLRLEAIAASEAARPEAKQIQNELDTLGPPPGEGAPAESPSVAAKRKAISDHLTVSEGTIKEAELVIAHADRILDKLASLRRTRFTERLLTRGPSPLSPSVWQKALSELDESLAAASQEIDSWRAGQLSNGSAPRFALQLSLGIVAAFVLVWPLRLWLLRRFGYITLEGEPSHAQRLRTALFTGFIRILLPSAAAIAVYLALTGSGMLSDAGQVIAQTALLAFIFVFFVAAFCRAALAPFEPEWRIVQIGDVAARSVSGTLTLIALVFALDRIADEFSNQNGASLELTVVHKFISGLIIAGLLLVLLRRQNWNLDGDETAANPQQPRPWQRLRFFLALLVLAIPASALLGYVALSRVLATQFVLTAGLYVAVILTRALLSEAVEQSLSANTYLGQKIRTSLSLNDESSEMLRFWVTETLGVVVVLIGVIALMVLWGAGEHDISGWLAEAILGFKLGNLTISLADIFLAILLFVSLLTLTRLIQRTLEQRIFPRTRIDMGVRNSIRASVGYVGFIIAGTTAVSVIGVDLSSLALIAGALSVGIGLGLQNIVNNFVSGLILLVERPIKVGDWVVVGDHQGYVKKISVRATEVSTFDQASVFIPNSSLIANAVMNRTYADKLGRVQIPVGVAYGTDAKYVREQLMAIANAHHEVRRAPSPIVFFKGFGDSALNFELVAIINDVDKVKAVTSDLCFEIDEVFRKEGIHIPFPKRDVTLAFRSDQLDALVSALGRTPEQPADGKGEASIAQDKRPDAPGPTPGKPYV